VETINFKGVLDEILRLNRNTTLIVVCKKQNFEKIKYIIGLGHKDFGENRIQDAIIKWDNSFKQKNNIKLHFIGKLQSNKVKEAVHLFDYIHSLDSIKLAKKLNEQEILQKRQLKYFIQVNFGQEIQKSGLNQNDLSDFLSFCRFNTKLKIIGLMCIPPQLDDPSFHFKKLFNLSRECGLKELSMGMSSDYQSAINLGATFVRVGSAIFK